MNYIAKWGPMGFVVSPTKIIPFNNLSTTIAIKTDTANDANGNPPTNVRGRELQSMNFSTTYLRAAGVDPRARYEQWGTLVGQTYPLYVGGKRFGPAKMMLSSVAISDLLLSNKGDFLSVTVDITLTEYSEGGKSTTTTNNAASAKAAETYAAVVAKKTAMNATASSADRERLTR